MHDLLIWLQICTFNNGVSVQLEHMNFSLLKKKRGHVDPDQELLCSNLSQSICSWPPSHTRVASSIGKDLGSKLGKKKAISFLKKQTSEKDKIQHREQAGNLIPGRLL